MHRRAALRTTLIAAAALAVSAHTPYRQWQVYRRRFLLIGTSRADAPTYPLGQRIAEVLATHLPESRARVSRGPDPWRLASLLTTGQMELILLSRADVEALRDGRAPFEAIGPTPLRALFHVGEHWLVSRPDFPERHAWHVSRTLEDQAEAFTDAGIAGPLAAPVPPHPGALAVLAGGPAPGPLELADDFPHPHVH